MPSQFDRLFAAGARSAHKSQFGETVVYWKRGASGGRTIMAGVDRTHPKVMQEAALITQYAEITVDDDDETGISASELDTGGDEIEYSERVGKTATRRPITKLLKQRGGRMLLEVR